MNRRDLISFSLDQCKNLASLVVEMSVLKIVFEKVLRKDTEGHERSKEVLKSGRKKDETWINVEKQKSVHKNPDI